MGVKVTRNQFFTIVTLCRMDKATFVWAEDSTLSMNRVYLRVKLLQAEHDFWIKVLIRHLLSIGYSRIWKEPE